MTEVVTGEAVVLDLAVARFPSRMLALLIDIAVQFPVADLPGHRGLRRRSHLNSASGAAIYLAGLMFVVIGYPLIFETLSRGKTLGKMALGLRVVGDDGSPERFRQALVRALSAAFVEIWLPPFNLIGIPAGLITSMVSAKGKRLGDVFAGTFVIQERVPPRPDLAPVFTVVPAPLTGWAQHLELSRLSDQTAAAASSYLRRFYDLRPAAREQLGTAAGLGSRRADQPAAAAGNRACRVPGRCAGRAPRARARSAAGQAGRLAGRLAAGAPRPAIPARRAWRAGPTGPARRAGPAGRAGPARRRRSRRARQPHPATLPLEPDDVVTLSKPDQPEDYGFATPF